MPAISSSVGLISGLNTADIINQLMSIEAQPATILQTQMNNVSQQRAAFADLRLIAVRQAFDELMGVGGDSGFHHFRTKGGAQYAATLPAATTPAPTAVEATS